MGESKSGLPFFARVTFHGAGKICQTGRIAVGKYL